MIEIDLMYQLSFTGLQVTDTNRYWIKQISILLGRSWHTSQKLS